MPASVESVGAPPDVGSRSHSPGPEGEFDRRERDRLGAKIAVYDRIAEWRERRVAQSHYYSRELRRLVHSLTPPRSRILEVGCGLGDLLASLGGSRSVGIDVSPGMIDRARRRHPGLELHVTDVERDPLPEGPFDVIVLSDAVGHLDDIQRGLERLGPLVAPGGRLIVTYYSFLWEPALKLAERLGLKTPWPEQNWLSMADIENLLGLADFEVVRRGAEILLPVGVPGVAAFANREEPAFTRS